MAPRRTEKYTKYILRKRTTNQANLLAVLVTTLECLKSSSVMDSNIFAASVSFLDKKIRQSINNILYELSDCGHKKTLLHTLYSPEQVNNE